MLFPSQKPSSSYSLLNFLRHQSVSGAPPPKKNPGSAPEPSDEVYKSTSGKD